MRILIAGCGDVGTSLGERLAHKGHEVWGLRRHPEALPAGIRPLAADLSRPETLADLPPGLDVLVYAAAADGFRESAYAAAYEAGVRNCLAALAAQGQRLRRVLFTSSTAVYDQAEGEWVDEESPTTPSHFAGRSKLAGERLVLDGPYPGTVLRLGGIYGPGRNRLLESVRQGDPCVDRPPVYTNRIHRDDAAGALLHLLGLDAPAAVYLGVDHDPASQCEVMSWLAGRLDVAPPRRLDADEAPQRVRGNKRCSNARLRASGYVFRYPSFREGYGELIAAADGAA